MEALSYVTKYKNELLCQHLPPSAFEVTMTDFPKPECITVQDGHLQGAALAGWALPEVPSLSAFLLVSLGVHQYSLVLIKIYA